MTTSHSYLSAAYTYDDAWQDTSLSQFNINKTPAEVFTILNDIKGINPYLKVHLLPWSPVCLVCSPIQRGISDLSIRGLAG